MRLMLPMPGNRAFAARLAREAGAELGRVQVHTYPGGESAVILLNSPKGRMVDIVCTLSRANASFLPLAFAADACREYGAAEVNLIAPYLGYMRYDAHFTEGDAVTSRIFARLVSGAFDRLITVDPHLHRHHALSDIYSIPAQALSATGPIAAWIAKHVPQPLIVGPDSESEQWAAQIGAITGAPHVCLAKQRRGDLDVQVTAPDLSAHWDRRPVVVDDIASSGRTLIAAAEALKAQGFPPPLCIVVHGIFAGDALKALRRSVWDVISTDSVPHPTNAIRLAPTMAAALGRRK